MKLSTIIWLAFLSFILLGKSGHIIIYYLYNWINIFGILKNKGDKKIIQYKYPVIIIKTELKFIFFQIHISDYKL